MPRKRAKETCALIDCDQPRTWQWVSRYQAKRRHYLCEGHRLAYQRAWAKMKRDARRTTTPVPAPLPYTWTFERCCAACDRLDAISIKLARSVLDEWDYIYIQPSVPAFSIRRVA